MRHMAANASTVQPPRAMETHSIFHLTSLSSSMHCQMHHIAAGTSTVQLPRGLYMETHSVHLTSLSSSMHCQNLL